MTAYLISDVEVRDAEAFEAYRTQAAESIALYGGRYVVRGGDVEALEGSWQPRAIIIVEFSDADEARRWYQSSEYAVALAWRDKALSRNLILVDGIGVSQR